jgi:hypothetical protein
MDPLRSLHIIERSLYACARQAGRSVSSVAGMKWGRASKRTTGGVVFDVVFMCCAAALAIAYFGMGSRGLVWGWALLALASGAPAAWDWRKFQKDGRSTEQGGTFHLRDG